MPNGQDPVVVLTDAQVSLLVASSSLSTFAVTCKTPLYNPDTTVGATFSATFEILEGGIPLPWTNRATPPVLKFQTVGPVISNLPDATFYLPYIKANSGTYPDGKLSLSFMLTDADSNVTEIELSFDSSNKPMVPVETIGATGVFRGENNFCVAI